MSNPKVNVVYLYLSRTQWLNPDRMVNKIPFKPLIKVTSLIYS